MPSKTSEEPQEASTPMQTVQEVVTREVTATDKINKYLLQSLLVRMNKSDESLRKFENLEEDPAYNK